MRSNKACLAPDCVAANPSQRDASADLARHGVTAEWARSAMVCSNCNAFTRVTGMIARSGGIWRTLSQVKVATKCAEGPTMKFKEPRAPADTDGSPRYGGTRGRQEEPPDGLLRFYFRRHTSFALP
jgi:hypothetical protein